MISHLSERFVVCFRKLPIRIKNQARKNYKLWEKDNNHPGLDFKLVGNRKPIYSARISIGWRALGIKNGNEIIWFWVGSHTDYERLLKKF